MEKPLTNKQKAVLNFIESWCEDKGYPPSIREIAKQIGVKSTNAVHNYLKILYRKGYLTREDMKSRTWRPVSKLTRQQKISIPVVGRIAAGTPVHSEENMLGTIGINKEIIGTHENLFALKVTGDSMIEAGILDGDYVIVNPDAIISSGDIVAVMIGGESTVKFYFKERNTIRLQPANKKMAPIYLNFAKDSQIETTIAGKVVGIYRKLV